MTTITVQNRQRTIPLDVPTLQSFATAALQAVGNLPPEPGDALADLEEVGVTVVSGRRIARLHRDFMNIAGPTDVLTFVEGDIVISAETAARYGADFGHSPLREVALYILHGLLHLRGYDDVEPDAAARMRAVQDPLFARLAADLPA